MTSEVGGGGNICHGQITDSLYQALPGFGLGEVTAVEKNVAVLVEGVGPQRDTQAILLQGFSIEAGIAQLYRAVGTVRNDVYRVEILVQLKHRGDLLDAVTITVEDNHFDVAAVAGLVFEVGDECLIIVYRAVDEHQFVTLLCRRFGH